MLDTVRLSSTNCCVGLREDRALGYSFSGTRVMIRSPLTPPKDLPGMPSSGLAAICWHAWWHNRLIAVSSQCEVAHYLLRWVVDTPTREVMDGKGSTCRQLVCRAFQLNCISTAFAVVRKLSFCMLGIDYCSHWAQWGYGVRDFLWAVSRKEASKLATGSVGVDTS